MSDHEGTHASNFATTDGIVTLIRKCAGKPGDHDDKTCGNYLHLDSGWLQGKSMTPTNCNLVDLKTPCQMMHYLQHLDVSHNNLTDTCFLRMASYLQRLNVSHNALAKLNCSFLENLTTLDASHNNLSTFQLRDLSALRTLNLSNNQLVSLPDELCECLCLEHLDVANNALYSLPGELSNLKSLKTCLLNGNMLQWFPPRAERMWFQKLDLRGNKNLRMPKHLRGERVLIDKFYPELTFSCINDLVCGSLHVKTENFGNCVVWNKYTKRILMDASAGLVDSREGGVIGDSALCDCVKKLPHVLNQKVQEMLQVEHAHPATKFKSSNGSTESDENGQWTDDSSEDDGDTVDCDRCHKGQNEKEQDQDNENQYQNSEDAQFAADERFASNMTEYAPDLILTTRGATSIGILQQGGVLVPELFSSPLSAHCVVRFANNFGKCALVDHPLNITLQKALTENMYVYIQDVASHGIDHVRYVMVDADRCCMSALTSLCAAWFAHEIRRHVAHVDVKPKVFADLIICPPSYVQRGYPIL